MPHVLVTGGAGFIGSNLCRRLLRDGHEVTVLDDLSEGERENLRELDGRPGFRFVLGDVRDAAAVAGACAGATHVAHLAARKIPRYGGALATLDVNAGGTRAVLDAALAARARVVLASTSDVYGKNPDVPFAEYRTASVLGHSKVRRWSYAVSKLFEEHVAFAMHEELGLDVVVLRYFGGYGPFQHRGWLGGPQSVFMERAFAGEPLPVHGDGSQRRTFTHVDDLVEGTVRALFSPEARGELFNVGGAEEVTVLELARRCWRLARDDEPRVELQPYEGIGGNYEDVLRRVPDLAHARARLGFEARVPLDEGLRATWAWMRSNRLGGAPCSGS
ncbi:MAG: SDR family NAD(P)-dependent oxidoreductase [Planctomycetes bacterium]|nr:SDR family NAD(P)-dependent oxidoreductase [Planctomycetota bacterium]